MGPRAVYGVNFPRVYWVDDNALAQMNTLSSALLLYEEQNGGRGSRMRVTVWGLM